MLKIHDRIRLLLQASTLLSDEQKAFLVSQITVLDEGALKALHTALLTEDDIIGDLLRHRVKHAVRRHDIPYLQSLCSVLRSGVRGVRKAREDASRDESLQFVEATFDQLP